MCWRLAPGLRSRLYIGIRQVQVSRGLLARPSMRGAQLVISTGDCPRSRGRGSHWGQMASSKFGCFIRRVRRLGDLRAVGRLALGVARARHPLRQAIATARPFASQQAPRLLLVALCKCASSALLRGLQPLRDFHVPWLRWHNWATWPQSAAPSPTSPRPRQELLRN